MIYGGNMELKTETTWARLTPIEKQILQAIMKIEQLNESETIRFIIRHYAKMYDFWPVVSCPDCESINIEQLNYDGNITNLRCNSCGLHFGNENIY
jgi:ribosomal protein S27E